MRSEKAALLTAVPSARLNLSLPTLTLGHVWIVCVLVLVMGYVCTPASFALDLWQHLTLGREMVQTHHLLGAERFAHTLNGQTVLNQNWLSEIILYLVYSAGGRAGVTCFVAGLYTLAFGAILYVCWRRSGHTRLAVGCTLLAAAIACENLSLRTQVFSALCLALELLVLWTDAAKRWRPLAVGLIVLLWTNTHGAFALGIALPAMFAAARAVTLLAPSAKRGVDVPAPSTPRLALGASTGRTCSLAVAALLRDAELRALALAVACATLAAFCNPHPDQTIAYVCDNMSAGLRRHIQEWQPIPFASLTGKFFFGSLALLPLILKWSRKRIEATEAILLVAFICLGAKAWRMAMWYGFVVAPILAAHLATRLPTVVGGRASRPPSGSAKTCLIDWAFLAIVLMLGGLSLPWFKAYNPMLPAARRAAVPPDEPQALAAFLQQRPANARSAAGGPATGKAYNPMEWGGYLMWHLDGRMQVFVDGRIDPFSDAVWADYEAIGAGRADWDDLLQRYAVTTLIADRRKMATLVKLAAASPRWKQVYSDPLAVVFEVK